MSTVKIYPNELQKVYLEWVNPFTKEKEVASDIQLLKNLLVALTRLSEDLEHEQILRKNLLKLPKEQQESIAQILDKIYFQDENYFYLQELHLLLQKASVCGFMDGLETFTTLQSENDDSFYQIQDSFTLFVNGFYCLSGFLSDPDMMDLAFHQLPFSRARYLKNPDEFNLNNLIEPEKSAHSWDNPGFLMQTLLPLLKIAGTYKDQIIQIDNVARFPDSFWDSLNDTQIQMANQILKSIPADDWEVVRDIFSKAEELGILDLYNNRKVKKVLLLLPEILAFYKDQTPEFYKDNLFEHSNETQISELEQLSGVELPKDFWTFLMQNTLAFDFDGNFQVLKTEQIIKIWKSMAEFLDNGTFNDGRVKKHIEQGFDNWEGGALKQVWWSKKWIPFAEDSCGNMVCIDLDPGPNGQINQLINMEVQDGQGPFLMSQWEDFYSYLDAHLSYLKNKRYHLVEYQGSSKMIEIDSYL